MAQLPDRIAGRRVLTERQLVMEDIPDPSFMLCALCPHEEWVSPEDSDASLGQLIYHLGYHHNLYTPEQWSPVLAQTVVVVGERP